MAESAGTEAWLAYYRKTGQLTDSSNQNDQDSFLAYARHFADIGNNPPGWDNTSDSALEILKSTFTKS